MSSRSIPSVRRRSAFTLIELLVVVAIIALLISILLPSLSRARSQARTALCLSRIAQMAKAFLVYADDYNETPPFLATGHNYGWMNHTPDPIESWLVDCGWADPNDDSAQFAEAQSLMYEITYRRQEQWTGPDVPRSGTLFTYTRFEGLYKCPEFERISHVDKAQNVFNYTRAIWARYLRLPIEMGFPDDVEWGDVEGPIMKPSQITSPAALPMVLDEQWNRFCAVGPLYETDPEGCYNGNDYLFAEHNVIAVSHGQPVACSMHPYDTETHNGTYDPFLWKRGGGGYYDGHAALLRDPWPTFNLGTNYRNPGSEHLRLSGTGQRGYDEMLVLELYLRFLSHAQRGWDIADRYGTAEWLQITW